MSGETGAGRRRNAVRGANGTRDSHSEAATSEAEASGASQGAQPIEPLAFEETMGRLDATVNALEGGQLPLEDALRLYEEGVRLAQRCQQMLDQAELRIQRLQVRAGDDESEAGGGTTSLYVLETLRIDERD